MPTKENGYSRFVKELSRELATPAAKGFKMFGREWERLTPEEKNGWKQLAKGTTTVIPPLPSILPPETDDLGPTNSVPPKAVARSIKNDSKRGVNADQYSCFYDDLTKKPMPEKYTYHPNDDEDVDVYGLSALDYTKLSNFRSGVGYTATPSGGGGLTEEVGSGFPRATDTDLDEKDKPKFGDSVKKALGGGRGRAWLMTADKKLTLGGGTGGMAMSSSSALEGADGDAAKKLKGCSRGRGRRVLTAAATMTLEGGLVGSETSSTLGGVDCKTPP